MLEETGFFQFLLKQTTDVLVFILEDVLAERFDFLNHIPRLIVGDSFHDVFQQPL